MIHGCIADEYGYFDHAEYNITTPIGPELRINPCPYGYNMRLLDQVYGFDESTGKYVANYTNLLEIQQLNCHANTGSFRIKFRDDVSGIILANDTTTYGLQRILTNMQKVGQVNVTISDDYTDGLICSYDNPRDVRITFLSEFGSHIPLLQITDDQVTNVVDIFSSLSFSRIQRGSDDGLLECSGHGDCDVNTGRCMCYPFYGTSDGQGNPGVRGDCGYHQI